MTDSKPLITVRGHPVKILGAWEMGGVTYVEVETLDGSKPFEQHVARNDPEEPFPGRMMTNWDSVPRSELRVHSEYFPG